MVEIWRSSYTAKKGDVSLHMFRKHLGPPDRSNPRPVLFLVHGSSFSGPSGFDLTVPGRDDYSLMDEFARRGYDVWTLDHEGYGRSDWREGYRATIADGVEDLLAGVEVVEYETGLNSYLFYGQSSGALRLAGFAAVRHDACARIVLDAFVWTGEGAPVWTGEGAPTLIERRKKLAQWTASHKRPVDRAFYHSIFNRDMPGTSEPAVADALADAELALCREVPTGTYADMCSILPTVDPIDIVCPTMILRGEHDGIATEEDLFAFFNRLPNTDKQFSIIEGQAHVSPLGVNRHRFWHVMDGFLNVPARRDPYEAEELEEDPGKAAKGGTGMSDIWAKEYTATKRNIPLHVFRKRAGAPNGEGRPVLFLVHGSSFSGRSGFDLQVPGKSDYSMMDYFARAGFDVWTMDHEGYGRSAWGEGAFSYVRDAVEDLAAVMPIVESETGRKAMCMYGGSSGALRAAVFAAACPNRVERLALAAMVYTGKGSPTLAKRSEKLALWKSSNKRPADRALFSSIFNRDKPGTSEDEVAEALADAEAPLCTHVPTGTYIDMCENLPVVEPEQVTCPTLVVRSEHDGIATDEDVFEFFVRLPNKDKQFTMMDGQSHAATLGINRHRSWHVLRVFLTMPKKQTL